MGFITQIKDTAAIVTGGGHATARTLADHRVRMFALDIAGSTVDGVTYVEADVTDSEQVQAALGLVEDSAVPLRVAVNCAGISAYAPFLADRGGHDLSLFRKVVEVNPIGTFNMMVLASEAIAKTEPLEDGARSVLINTASIGAFDGLAGTAPRAAWSA